MRGRCGLCAGDCGRCAAVHSVRAGVAGIGPVRAIGANCGRCGLLAVHCVAGVAGAWCGRAGGHRCQGRERAHFLLWFFTVAFCIIGTVYGKTLNGFHLVTSGVLGMHTGGQFFPKGSRFYF
jgi:hypothetical protein